jgi:hypothetical protein
MRINKPCGCVVDKTIFPNDRAWDNTPDDSVIKYEYCIFHQEENERVEIMRKLKITPKLLRDGVFLGERLYRDSIIRGVDSFYKYWYEAVIQLSDLSRKGGKLNERRMVNLMLYGTTTRPRKKNYLPYYMYV